MNQYRTAKEVLDVIDEFLADKAVSRTEQGALWGLLSVVRGPDTDSGELKMKTTACLRAAMFPTSVLWRAPGEYTFDGEIVGAIANRVERLMPMDDLENNEGGDYQWHFVRHITWAVEVLKGMGRLP
jgi:hypothetical protein